MSISIWDSTEQKLTTLAGVDRDAINNILAEIAEVKGDNDSLKDAIDSMIGGALDDTY